MRFTRYYLPMKWCPKCKTEKLESEFYTDKTRTVRNKLAGHCKECCRSVSAKNRAENPAKHIAYSREYYRLNYAKFKHHNLMQSYGISLDEFRALAKKQKGCCAICRRHHSKCAKGKGKKPRIRLYVDHCHKTGKVRGLLCHHCNSMLCHIATPELLLRAALYLRKSTKQERKG